VPQKKKSHKRRRKKNYFSTDDDERAARVERRGFYSMKELFLIAKVFHSSPFHSLSLRY
jgi:hypothetical protein